MLVYLGRKCDILSFILIVVYISPVKLMHTWEWVAIFEVIKDFCMLTNDHEFYYFNNTNEEIILRLSFKFF